MTRRMGSVLAIVLGVLLFGLQGPVHAQTVGSDGIYKGASTSALVKADGYFFNGLPAGFMYFELPTGENFSGSWSTLSFKTLASGKMQATGTSKGWLYAYSGNREGGISVHATFVYDPNTNAGTVSITAKGVGTFSYSLISGLMTRTSGTSLITL